MSEKKKAYVNFPIFRVARENAAETAAADTNTILRQQISEIREQFQTVREELRAGLIQPIIQRRLERVSSLLSAFQQQTPQKKAEREAEIVKCPQCGAEMPKTAKYCSECGSMLKPETQWAYRGKLQLRS